MKRELLLCVGLVACLLCQGVGVSGSEASTEESLVTEQVESVSLDKEVAELKKNVSTLWGMLLELRHYTVHQVQHLHQHTMQLQHAIVNHRHPPEMPYPFPDGVPPMLWPRPLPDHHHHHHHSGEDGNSTQDALNDPSNLQRDREGNETNGDNEAEKPGTNMHRHEKDHHHHHHHHPHEMDHRPFFQPPHSHDDHHHNMNRLEARGSEDGKQCIYPPCPKTT